MQRRDVLRVSAVGIGTLLGGCAALSSPEIVEQQCGNVVGVGGCVVTVENPSDSTRRVEVTVEAISDSGDVAASGSEVVRLGGGQQGQVEVGVSNLGGSVDHYEVSASWA